MEYYIHTAKDGDGVSAFRDSAGDAGIKRVLLLEEGG